MKKIFIGILFFISLLRFDTFAQTCPPNIDFETGTHNNWEFYIGVCCSIVTPWMVSPVSGRHDITSGAFFDYYGNFPTVAPGGGNYSFKLGNSNSGSEAERARYYVHVPSGPGRYILVYRYAVVFEDPKHMASEQPRFEVSAFDSATLAPIPCSQYTYVASSTIPGFVKSTNAADVYYKPWATATLDLSSAAGRTVAIDFASGDCGLGAHFGYGYVDMNCGLFQIYALECNNKPFITLSAPGGFAHYKWMNTTFTTVLDTNRVATLPVPGVPTTYAVILTPYPGYGCTDTLYTTYVVANTEAHIDKDTTICLGGRVQLNGVATTNDSPLVYSWAPLKGLSCINCPNPVARPKATTTYAFIATSKAGCADTDYVKVRVDSSLSYVAHVTADRDTVCPWERVNVKNVFIGRVLTSGYSWKNTGAVVLIGAQDSATLAWTTPGLKKIYIDVAGQDCFETDTAYVYVKAPEYISTPGDIYICPNDTAQLSVTTNSTISLVYNWYPGIFLSCTKCDKPKSVTPKNMLYYVTTINEGICHDTQALMVHIDTVDAQINIPRDTVCRGQVIEIKNNITQTSTNVKYTWSVADGTIISNNNWGKIQVNWNSPGVKQVKLRIDGSNCDGQDSVKLYVLPPFTADFKIADYACENDVVTVEAIRQDAYYHWTVTEQEVPDTLYKKMGWQWSDAGRKYITLLVSNRFQCDSQWHTDSVDIYPMPKAYLQTTDAARICAGDVVHLTTTPDPNYKYKWKPEGQYDYISGANATITIKNSDTISVTATNQFGCDNTSVMYVNTRLCCKVLMPDAFTPNGDGRNDTYHPVGIDKQKVEVFMIANRWGQIIFESTNAQTGWDGTIRGKKQDAGTFSYFLKYACDGETFEEKGNFILIR